MFYGLRFLGLGVLVTLGALHHHRRTGGWATAERRLVVATAVATLALTALLQRGGGPQRVTRISERASYRRAVGA